MKSHFSSIEVSSWDTRQVILATLFVVLVGLGFWLVYQVRLVIFLLFTAIVLSTAIDPAVSWLSGRGISRAAGVIIVYVILFASIAVVIGLAAPLIANQTTQIAYGLPKYYANLRSMLLSSHSRLVREIGINLASVNQLLGTPSVASQSKTIDQVGQSLQFAGSVSRTVFIAAAMFLLAFFWTLEKERDLLSLILFLSKQHREGARSMIAGIETRLGGYIRGEAILLFAIGLMSFAAYQIIGLPNALVLALIAGLLEAIPLFGPVLGSIPAVLVAFSLSPAKVVWVLVATSLIQMIENHWFSPRIMKHTVGVNPITTLLALAAFSSLLGLPGAFMAVPLAAVIQLVLERFVLQPAHQVEADDLTGRDQYNLLRYEAHNLVQDVRKQLRRKNNLTSNHSDQMEDNIERIAIELDALLVAVNQQEQIE